MHATPLFITLNHPTKKSFVPEVRVTGVDHNSVCEDRGEHAGDEIERLVVNEPFVDDNSSIFLSQSEVEELNLTAGGTARIKGNQCKDAVCIALKGNIDHAKIQMNEVVRKNLRVRLGDSVSVHVCDPPDGTRTQPVDDIMEGTTGNLVETYRKPYYYGCYRPARQEDLFLVRRGSRAVAFNVGSVDPGDCVIVGPDTVIHCELSHGCFDPRAWSDAWDEWSGALRGVF